MAVVAQASPSALDQHLAQLREAAVALEDRHVLHGELPLGAAGVTLAGPSFGELVLPATLQAARPALKALVAACAPAPFGVGGLTVVDPVVRRALALPAAGFAVRGIAPDAWARLLEGVRSALVPDALHVDAEPDKLNLYLQDGHFAAHRDTPGDAEHFGTLVLCLPLVFGGGNFTLRHQNAVTELAWDEAVLCGQDPSRRAFSRDGDLDNVLGGRQSWSSDTDETRDAVAAVARLETRLPVRKVFYAAFFGHCEHAISTVQFGARLTIAYKLRRRDAAVVPASLSAAALPLALAQRTVHFAAVLRAALADAQFLPTGGHVGFACFHLYEDRELPEAGSTVDAASAAGLRLKGADYLVAASAGALGLPVEPLRIFTETNVNDRYIISRFPPDGRPQHFARKEKIERSFTDWGTSCDTLRQKLGNGKEELLASHWAVPLPFTGRGTPRTDVLTPAKPMDTVFFGRSGYFGNEASTTTFYAHAALVVHVPPWAARTPSAASAAAVAATETAEGAEIPPTVGEHLSRTLAAYARAAADKAAAGPTSTDSVAPSRPTDPVLASRMQRIEGAQVSAIKSLLKGRGLPLSGNKRELIERAVANIAIFTEDDLTNAMVPIFDAEQQVKALKRARSGSVPAADTVENSVAKRPALVSAFARPQTPAVAAVTSKWSADYFA